MSPRRVGGRLPPDVTEAEVRELAGGKLLCHFDQKEKVHYVGVFEDGGGAAPRMALTALRLLLWHTADYEGSSE